MTSIKALTMVNLSAGTATSIVVDTGFNWTGYTMPQPSRLGT